MPCRRLFLVLLLSLSLTQCRTVRPVANLQPTAEVIGEDFMTCFDAGLADAKTWCEASAVLAQGDRIYFANDKDMPAPNSSVFYRMGLATQLADTTRQPAYLTTETLRTGHKYEDFAQSPDGNWIFLTTAFDRVKDTPDWDGYNTLLCWKPGQEAAVQVVSPDAGSKTSVGFRKAISRAVGGLPYFKIEGLAATNTDLIWGIREEGQTFEKFEYKVKFLKSPYRVRTDAAGVGRVMLADSFTLLREVDLKPICEANGLPQPMGVSSIEYDKYRRGFWVLTSYEQKSSLGACLWFIPETDLLGNTGSLQLVKTPDGKPLTFSHKAEDLTLTDQHTLLVIHDDDREVTTIGTRQRRRNQAAYTLLRLR